MITNGIQTTAEKMTAVKAAWEHTPMGPRKDAALKHYRAAQAALLADDDAECNRELDATTLALR